MAKILNRTPSEQWVFLGVYTCRHCGTLFQVEPGDPGLKIRHGEFDVFCPVCNGDNRYKRGPDVAVGPGSGDPVLPSHTSELPGV